jgi:hypothetical protein
MATDYCARNRRESRCKYLHCLTPSQLVDRGLSSSGEPILRRHMADGAVQSHRVVVIHSGLNQAACISTLSGPWNAAIKEVANAIFSPTVAVEILC